jgi:hypothetical protein
VLCDVQLLWRYNKEAVALRIQYLTHTPMGAESHTVMALDIPGVAYGTYLDRLDKTAFRFLPRRMKVQRWASGRRWW